MTIPEPLTERFNAAPAGKIRVVAWRQRTETFPHHPDLVPIHTERAQLLHWWASTYNLSVDDWGATDAERPAEYVELLIDLAQATLAAGLGALATGYVQQRFLDRRKGKASDKPKPDGTDSTATAPPSVRPLMGLTLVNERGGTVIVLNAAEQNDVSRAVQQVMEPEWGERITLERASA